LFVAGGGGGVAVGLVVVRMVVVVVVVVELRMVVVVLGVVGRRIHLRWLEQLGVSTQRRRIASCCVLSYGLAWPWSLMQRMLPPRG
jgi:hypothetical protein